jgi:large subunit ribosomal protein L9
MKVILNNEVPNLGDAGDVVKVAPGFARNYLLPRGLATVANEGSLAVLEHQKRVAEAKRRKALADARALASKVEATPVTIRRETGEDDRLFGSVSNRDIADALGQEGIAVDRKHILLEEPLRNIGIFTVPVRLHKDVTANVKVFVIKG